jgi:hypothetical protein
MEEHDNKKRDTQHSDRTLRIATLSLVTLSIMTINTVDTVVLSVVNKLIMLRVVNKANYAELGRKILYSTARGSIRVGSIFA